MPMRLTSICYINSPYSWPKAETSLHNAKEACLKPPGIFSMLSSGTIGHQNHTTATRHNRDPAWRSARLQRQPICWSTSTSLPLQLQKSLQRAEQLQKNKTTAQRWQRNKTKDQHLASAEVLASRKARQPELRLQRCSICRTGNNSWKITSWTHYRASRNGAWA